MWNFNPKSPEILQTVIGGILKVGVEIQHPKDILNLSICSGMICSKKNIGSLIQPSI